MLHPIIHTFYKIGVIQFGDYQLKNGEHSSVYINLRKIISYPSLLQDITSAMWNCVKQNNFDLVCGVPYTALPLATCLSLNQNLPMVMRRKEKKDYGTKQMIEGVFQPQQNCLLLEDVITTGGSILETTQELEAAGLIITHVVAVMDRNQQGKENLEKKYRMHTLFSLNESLNALINSEYLSTTETKLAQEFLIKRDALC